MYYSFLYCVCSFIFNVLILVLFYSVCNGRSALMFVMSSISLVVDAVFSWTMYSSFRCSWPYGISIPVFFRVPFPYVKPILPVFYDWETTDSNPCLWMLYYFACFLSHVSTLYSAWMLPSPYVYLYTVYVSNRLLRCTPSHCKIHYKFVLLFPYMTLSPLCALTSQLHVVISFGKFGPAVKILCLGNIYVLPLFGQILLYLACMRFKKKYFHIQ
jgi:hypothetical protein